MFPQYGRASGVAAYAGVGNPAVPTHGFLSHLHWTLVDAGGSDPDAEDPCPTVVLEAESTTETYAVWPYHFRAVYTVSTSHHPRFKIDTHQNFRPLWLVKLFVQTWYVLNLSLPAKFLGYLAAGTCPALSGSVVQNFSW